MDISKNSQVEMVRQILGIKRFFQIHINKIFSNSIYINMNINLYNKINQMCVKHTQKNIFVS